MIFIGIVTDSKSEESIISLLENNKILKNNKVIFIKESNIDNIKNIYFDTIIINENFKNMSKLILLLEHAKNIIVNIDEKILVKNIIKHNVNFITYGFNSKASITISSATEDEVLICIQRNVYSSKGIIEVQEIKIEKNENCSIYDLIIVVVMFILYTSCNEKINIICRK